MENGTGKTENIAIYFGTEKGIEADSKINVLADPATNVLYT